MLAGQYFRGILPPRSTSIVPRRFSKQQHVSACCHGDSSPNILHVLPFFCALSLTHAHTHTHTCTHAHMHSHTNMHTFTDTHAHTHARTHTHIHAHAHTHTHTHTHTQLHQMNILFMKWCQLVQTLICNMHSDCTMLTAE